MPQNRRKTDNLINENVKELEPFGFSDIKKKRTRIILKIFDHNDNKLNMIQAFIHIYENKDKDFTIQFPNNKIKSDYNAYYRSVLVDIEYKKYGDGVVFEAFNLSKDNRAIDKFEKKCREKGYDPIVVHNYSINKILEKLIENKKKFYDILPDFIVFHHKGQHYHSHISKKDFIEQYEFEVVLKPDQGRTKTYRRPSVNLKKK